ncbi:MAG: Sec-independent protein translocase subunit TatA/TatB [Chloroflexota bacterium]
MFFSHMPELIAVLVIGLLFFGPKRLPEIGSSLGKGINELKHGLSEVHSQGEAAALPEADKRGAE